GLARKGVGAFLSDRLVRIGIPFALGVYLLMPVAHYPVYRLTAPDPSLSTFWAQWIALPFWASGPLWFLWHLLVLGMAAAALYRFAPGVGGWGCARATILPGISSRWRSSPRLPICRWLRSSSRGTCVRSGRLPSSPAACCTTWSISSPVSASAWSGSNAACCGRTDCCS